GFTFNLGGVGYTTFSISTNGFIKFGAAITGSHWTNSLANAAVQRPLITAFWDDNNLSTGTITYSLTGTAPNQILSVNFHNTKVGSTGSTAGAAVSSIIRLYETTNIVEIVFGSPFTTANSVSGSVGLNDMTSFLSVTPAVASTASGVTANNAINAAVMANLAGKKLIFTPPVVCSGTPTAGTVTPAIQNICSGIVPANLVATGFSTGVSGLTFQWQESDDNGVGDAWSNAVGGSGATTAAYTPPAFLGTIIYYRLNVTCTGSGLSAQTASVIVAPPANPSTQVTALSGVPAAVSAVLNWTNGNGGRRVVYLSDSPVFTDPVNGNAAALVANSVYGGSGQQIIYDGTAATTPVTGLTAATTYYVKVYEYLRCGAGPYDYYYNVSTGTNIFTLTTITPPANDDCTGAIGLTAGGVFADQDIIGTNVAATSATGLTYACQTNRKDDVWYSVVVPASGNITIETDTTPGTVMTDSVLSVFSGTCGTLTEIGCDDDTGNGNFSKVALAGRTPGETLYIGVWAYTLSGGGDGQFALSAYDASLTAASFDIAGFAAYPNPVKDVLNLSYTKNISNVSIHNLLGQEVMTKTVNATQSKVDMSNLSQGTYLVKVTVDGLVKTLKVVKQ
ncbi:MAG: T9SS type A sorting domain-containing protein, partial [Flavobacterium sp.]